MMQNFFVIFFLFLSHIVFLKTNKVSFMIVCNGSMVSMSPTPFWGEVEEEERCQSSFILCYL